jgi:hypothetical protein
MAEQTKPWCFDPDTQNLGELSNAQQAFVDQFQAIHDQVTGEEWAAIVEPFDLENHDDLGEYNTKPTLFPDWFDLTEPIDCWTEPREALGSYNTSKEMENLVNLLKNIRDEVPIRIDEEGARTGGFSNPAFNTIVDDFVAGKWKDNTIDELRAVIAIMAEGEPAIKKIESTANGFLNEVELKIYAIPCPDIKYFKDGWTKAVLELAKPEADRIEALIRKGQFGGDKVGGVQRGFNSVADARKFSTFIKDKGRVLEVLEEQAEIQIEEAFVDNLVYSEQCMLLTFLPELLVSNKSKGIPYRTTTESNYPIKAQGDAFGFINRLVVDPSQKELFELKPSVVSQLTPYIRLYKVEKDKDGVDQETRIIFDTNIAKDLGPANAIKRQRGYGVGMNSFTFSYDGTDPFSAKKAISAKLSIFASTFQDLLKPRDGFKYADLALKTGGASKNLDLDDIEKENLDKLNFRLKATVGWNVPRETFVGLSTEIKNAMYNSYITIYLTPTIHSFDFDETGAVTFDIDYLAYIEDAMTQRSFNIFANLAKEQSAMESIVDALRKMECNESGEEFKKIKKVNEEFVSRINLNAYSNLVSKLAGRDKIYYLNMTYDQVEEVLRNPDSEDIKFPKPYTNSMVSQATANGIKAAATQLSGSTDGTNLVSIAAVSQDNESIPYFYLEDLVAVAMDNIEKTLRQGSEDLDTAEYFKFLKEKKLASINLYRAKKTISREKIKFKNSLQQFQQTRVILGPIEIYSPSRKYASFKTTLGNIPVSLNYFFEFMSEKVLSKEILNYPINKFVKDLVNDLIKNFLNSEGCTRVNNNQKLNINSTAITAYNRKERDRNKWEPGKPPLDDISHFLISGGRPEGPILLLNSKRDLPSAYPVEQMMNYYVFSAGRKYPIGSYVGDKGHDEKFGIFHYILGRDKGIIKNISLEKTTAPGLKEVRFEQEGYNGLEQLREVYNVKVDSFLNVQTFPGTYIYVEPRGFSPSTTDDLTRYGIGGYHMITKTTHRIAPGDASTTINAAWVCSKEGDSVENKKKKTKKREPEANEKINKCVVGVVDLGRLITGFDGTDLTPEERGKLGQELYEAAQEAGSNEGIYTV